MIGFLLVAISGRGRKGTVSWSTQVVSRYNIISLSFFFFFLFFSFTCFLIFLIKMCENYCGRKDKHRQVLVGSDFIAMQKKREVPQEESMGLWLWVNIYIFMSYVKFSFGGFGCAWFFFSFCFVLFYANKKCDLNHWYQKTVMGKRRRSNWHF